MSYVIEDKGVIIALRPYGETSAIVSVFSENHGLVNGYVKGAQMMQQSGTFQKGNFVTFTHHRHQEEALGYFKAESLYCIWSFLKSKKDALSLFTLLCTLLHDILP